MANNQYDLLVIVDATYSMSEYLKSLNDSLPKILDLSRLTNAFSRVGLIAYRDYCDRELLEWSEWVDFSASNAADMETALLKTAKELTPIGGGDYPEATKTALAKANSVIRNDAETIILLYTDAPPHIKGSKASDNYKKEATALEKQNDGVFADWVSGAKALNTNHKVTVFSILEPRMASDDLNYYAYLSEITKGSCFQLNNRSPKTISKATVDILLAWMDVEKAGTGPSSVDAKMHQYCDLLGASPENEVLLATSEYFDSKNKKWVDVTTEELKKHLKRETPIGDFAKRYTADESYRVLAVTQLRKIIADDVSSISINPVFGPLWRAVCNDRENPARDELIAAFGASIEKIQNESEKQRMKIWLAESYDYTAEVMEIINQVPADQHFPCVFLDPTLRFEKPSASDDPDEDIRPITEFAREELLEIGRSCDYKILRRLGRVLTRLSFATSAEEIPAHIAREKDLITIPLALASKESKRRFWRLFLHIVVPGTLLSARPAALVAALSIRLGIKPLESAADEAVLAWRNKWNNLDVPETWNASCLNLLLDADKAYCDRVGTAEGLLKADDRALFKTLVDYKLLELNLNTTLTARVGWKPEKAIMPIGPLVVCKLCLYPRSVTMMAAEHVCGNCAYTRYPSPEYRSEWIAGGVSKDDTESTDAAWVECSVRTCRAQYIVYHVSALNVRPKCFYCREQGTIPENKRNLSPAPTVECKTCLNRMIWPEEYRPASMGEFTCLACTSGKTSIVDVETTATSLTPENGTSWLLTNDNNKLKQPFNNRSLFHTISTAGTDAFTESVSVFPSPHPVLTLNGKLIHNATALVDQLKTWVSARRTEAGTCSLCFSTSRKDTIRPACGRSGCHQRICDSCLEGWYGLNGSGRIINFSALTCPFCRRAPTGKTLAKYGMGIHAVAKLADAVSEKGEWVYAWCAGCGTAKRYVERVCAGGAPADVSNWKCEECNVEAPLKTKECPGCGVMTEKISGCDHIECGIDSCGVHWCWHCGKQQDENVIYDHMQEEHGGMYGGLDYEDEE